MLRDSFVFVIDTFLRKTFILTDVFNSDIKILRMLIGVFSFAFSGQKKRLTRNYLCLNEEMKGAIIFF